MTAAVKRKALDFTTRYRALRKADGLCPYCGVELEHDHEDGAKIAFDHVIPLSRGGADAIENLIACCSGCNASKHTKTALEFFCEREGIEVPWFARFNPDKDGFSAPDDYEDLIDRTAWTACWPELEELGDDYALEHEHERAEVEIAAVLTRIFPEQFREVEGSP